jgi:ribosomal protein L29
MGIGDAGRSCDNSVMLRRRRPAQQPKENAVISRMRRNIARMPTWLRMFHNLVRRR